VFEQQGEKFFHGRDPSANCAPMSRQIPYQPMGPPRKEVSIEQMQAILAKRTGSKVELQTQTVAQPPKAELPKLEWEKPTSRDQMALMTKCGRYSCCKIVLNQRVTYECWALVPGVWFTQIAIGLPSFDAAKAVAQKHADAKAAKP
jgi:hypothetical protein